jgi:V/A-type H+-transporting ATPase subunit C
VARLDHLNARIGARRPALLGAPGLRELLARPTTGARVDLLLRTTWGAQLQGDVARAADPLGAVEDGLRRALAAEAARLLALAEGARARRLLEAFLALAEAAAVKAILRAIAAGAGPARALALAPPAAAPRPDALAELAAAPTVDALAAALTARGSALGPALAEALPARAVGGLLPLEVALDRAASARARAACRGAGEDGRILAAHLEDRADARNAATLLVLAGAGRGEGLFVPGGRRIGEDAFARLAGAPAQRVRDALAALFRGPARALASPAAEDRALEDALLPPLRRAARARPLSIAVPLAYLAERAAEARRIAVVLRGAELGLPADEILDLVRA